MSSKKVAAKTAKKVPAPKPTKVAKTKKSKNVINALYEARFVSFKVRAVIPVQQYGNIQPEIEVVAPTYELAVAFAMPKIEELWKTYAERPINGNSPKFVGPVSVAEKIVAPAPVPKEEPVTPASPSSTADSEVSASSSTSTALETPLSEAGQKAKKMIELAVTKEALNLVEDKVKNSIKIPEDEKPTLYTIILKKSKTI